MMTDRKNPGSGPEQNPEQSPKQTHVERAALGPTPDNPSLSLKARLKRAAFFDQRDRQVAEGKAEPIDPDAGLPEQMVEDIEELGEAPRPNSPK